MSQDDTLGRAPAGQRGPFAEAADFIDAAAFGTSSGTGSDARTPGEAVERLRRLGLVEDRDGAPCWAASDSVAVIGRLVRLLDGPARGLVPVPAGEGCPVSVYVAPEDEGGSAGRWRRWGGAAGSSVILRNAVVSCLFETAERCAQLKDGREWLRHARLSELDGPALTPRALLQFSDAQYAARARSNRLAQRAQWVPSPYDESRAIDWIEATRVGGEGSCWLPADYCLRSPPRIGERRACRADSNGCASAATLEDATVRGFLELVERDAVAIWWFNRIRRPGVDPAILRLEPMASIAAWQKDHGRALVLLDVTTDLGLPVVVAASFDREGRGIAMGFGCGFDLASAAARASVEMMQFHVQVNLGLFLHAALRTHNASPQTIAMWRWFLVATLADHPQIVPLSREEAPRPMRVPEDDGRLAPLARCGAAAARANLPIYMVDLTRAEIGVPTVRVIVPELRSIKPRLAPGRLYEIPVRLGWRGEIRPEQEMNPYPLVM